MIHPTFTYEWSDRLRNYVMMLQRQEVAQKLKCVSGEEYFIKCPITVFQSVPIWSFKTRYYIPFCSYTELEICPGTEI